MTNNESYIEYIRQVEINHNNNLDEQKKINKLVLITASILLSFIACMLVLNHFNIIHLS